MGLEDRQTNLPYPSAAARERAKRVRLVLLICVLAGILLGLLARRRHWPKINNAVLVAPRMVIPTIRVTVHRISTPGIRKGPPQEFLWPVTQELQRFPQGLMPLSLVVPDWRAKHPVVQRLRIGPTVKPDIATIIAHTKTGLAAATITRIMALSGLTVILSDLEADPRFSDTELEPLRQFIRELGEPPPKRPSYLQLML